MIPLLIHTALLCVECSHGIGHVTSDKVPDLGRSESDLDPSESDLGKCCHKSLVHDHGSSRLIKVTET